MGDLISREAAMNIFAVDLAEKDRQVSYQGFCIDAVIAIGSLPSAEKTGKWVPIVSHTKDGREKTRWFCSECGQAMYQFRQRFCSNCGADMREVE